MEATFLIALTTFRELVRSKVLYLVLFFAAVMVVVATLFGSVTIGDQALVIKDFGLAVMSLFSVAFAVIAGGSLLSKELSRKTVYNILAKPIERQQFIWGKFLGMFATSSMLALLMSLALFLFLWLASGTPDLGIMWGFVYALLELMIICAAAIFFSSLVVTPVLNGLFTFAFFLAGRSVGYLLYFVDQGILSGWPAQGMRSLYYILPHLASLNVNSAIVFADPQALSLARLCWSAIYSAGYSVILLLLATLIFRRREFN